MAKNVSVVEEQEANGIMIEVEEEASSIQPNVEQKEDQKLIDFETLKELSDQELQDLKKEIREKLAADKDSMFARRYTLLFPTQENELVYNEEKYFKDLLQYLNVKLSWKEYQFLTLEECYMDVKNTIAQSSSKSKIKDLPENFVPWTLSYSVIEGLYNLIYNNSGMGYSEVQQRKYIFYPINNSWAQLYKINLELNNLNNYIIRIDDELQTRVMKEVESIIEPENIETVE